jgi:hypothetical protein
MREMARSLGDVGEPFRWSRERRKFLRCEVDGLFFHLYGMSRDEVVHVMDSFPIVQRKDNAEFGEYRTKRLILEVFDAIRSAIDTGMAYESPLNPPPGHGPRHPAREVAA